SYSPLSPDEAAKLLGRSESDLGKPFLYRFPLGWLLLTAVLAIIVLRLSLAKRLKDKINPLPRDWRYQKALVLMFEQAKRIEAGGGAVIEGQATALSSFEVAVQYLIGQGVSQAEAEQKLGQFLAVLPEDVHRLLEDDRYARALGTLSEHDERMAPIS